MISRPRQSTLAFAAVALAVLLAGPSPVASDHRPLVAELIIDPPSR